MTTHVTTSSDRAVAPRLVLPEDHLPDLAPEIHRQRLVVEGLVERPIDAPSIVDYLNGLSRVCDMRVVQEPVTHRSDRYGWAAWIHWEASGAHFYAWEQPRLFFSVDVYTCKAFDAMAVVEFTASFFDTGRVVAKSF